MKLIKKIEMENTDGNHFKFWSGHLFSNNLVICEWGRIGQDNTQTKSFPNAGEEFLDKKVKEKENKGYVIV